MEAHELADLLGQWGYAAYLGLLCITGLGSPIPEDLILLTGGYLVSAAVFSFPNAYVAGVLGVIASDLMLYGWGHRLRVGTGTDRVRRLIGRQRIRRASLWLARLGDGAVFVARLLPGTRSFVFVGSGFRAMPLARFLFFDAMGAAVWVAIVLTIGTQLGEEIGGLDRLLATFGRLAGWIAVGAIALLVLWQLWRTEESKL